MDAFHLHRGCLIGIGVSKGGLNALAHNQLVGDRIVADRAEIEGSQVTVASDTHPFDTHHLIAIEGVGGIDLLVHHQLNRAVVGLST